MVFFQFVVQTYIGRGDCERIVCNYTSLEAENGCMLCCPEYTWFFTILFLFPPQCTRQIISEKLGRGSRTVDLELEAQIDILRDNKKKYENILRLAQTLSNQLFQMVHTQRQLGDAFADLSLKSLELHVRLL